MALAPGGLLVDPLGQIAAFLAIQLILRVPGVGSCQGAAVGAGVRKGAPVRGKEASEGLKPGVWKACHVKSQPECDAGVCWRGSFRHGIWPCDDDRVPLLRTVSDRVRPGKLGRQWRAFAANCPWLELAKLAELAGDSMAASCTWRGGTWSGRSSFCQRHQLRYCTVH